MIRKMNFKIYIKSYIPVTVMTAAEPAAATLLSKSIINNT